MLHILKVGNTEIARVATGEASAFAKAKEMSPTFGLIDVYEVAGPDAGSLLLAKQVFEAKTEVKAAVKIEEKPEPKVEVKEPVKVKDVRKK